MHNPNGDPHGRTPLGGSVPAGATAEAMPAPPSGAPRARPTSTLPDDRTVPYPEMGAPQVAPVAPPTAQSHHSQPAALAHSFQQGNLAVPNSPVAPFPPAVPNSPAVPQSPIPAPVYGHSPQGAVPYSPYPNSGYAHYPTSGPPPVQYGPVPYTPAPLYPNGHYGNNQSPQPATADITPERSGVLGLIVALAVVLILVGGVLAMYFFVFKDDTNAATPVVSRPQVENTQPPEDGPAPSQAPETPTPETKPQEAPAPEEDDEAANLPGTTKPEIDPEENSNAPMGTDDEGPLPGSLPQQAGVWQQDDVLPGVYNRQDGGDGFLSVVNLGNDSSMFEISSVMANTVDITGGFCYENVGIVSCVIHPGKSPESTYVLTGLETKVEEVIPIAEAIAKKK